MNTRRKFLGSAVAGAAVSALGGCAGIAGSGSGPQVVVVGGGYAGATAAKYIRKWSNGGIGVALIEPNPAFVSCPISNLVLGGTKTIADITTPYDGLQKTHGVRVVHGSVASIDAARHVVRLADGSTLGYAKLVLAPGIDFMYDGLPGLASDAAQARVLHAWKAGAQTVALRKQLEAMPDGGVYALAIPRAPYRCPPGPYERACQIAAYFKRAKPRSKVIVVDANDDVTSKGKLFKAAWAEHYKGIVDYRPKHTLMDVDASGGRLLFEFQDPLRADVLNVVPPMRAGSIAVAAGLATANGRWCEVDFLTFESKAARDVYVLGDATQGAPGMPKSGHMANQQAKVAASAIVAQLTGGSVNPEPMVTNTCYSFVTATEVVHVASVHRYDAQKKTFLTVPGSGGLSAGPTEAEGLNAFSWAKNIWADTLG